MTEYNSHTVSIDGQYFFAENPKSDVPVQRRRKVETKIEEGPTKWTFKGYDTRKITFKATLHGDVVETRETLAKLANKVCNFSSIYIGTFTAIVEYTTEVKNGTPNTTYVEFTIQEAV